MLFDCVPLSTHRPGDDHVVRAGALALDAVGVLVGHVGARGAHVRVRGGRRGPDLVPGHHPERVVGPGTQLHRPRRVDGGDAVAGHVPRVRCEASVVLDGEAKDGRSVVAHRVPSELGQLLVAVYTVQRRRVGLVWGRNIVV